MIRGFLSSSPTTNKSPWTPKVPATMLSVLVVPPTPRKSLSNRPSSRSVGIAEPDVPSLLLGCLPFHRASNRRLLQSVGTRQMEVVVILDATASFSINVLRTEAIVDDGHIQLWQPRQRTSRHRRSTSPTLLRCYDEVEGTFSTCRVAAPRDDHGR